MFIIHINRDIIVIYSHLKSIFKNAHQTNRKYYANFATRKGKKVKQSRYTPWRRLGERRYSSYSFTTSALDGDEWSASRPGRALAPGKGPPVPIVQEARWAPKPVWTQRLE
jgi:hypothetical protein